jgi:hypothetical protein
MPHDILRLRDPAELLLVARDALRQATLHDDALPSKDYIRRVRWQCDVLISRMRDLLGTEADLLFQPYERIDYGHRDFELRESCVARVTWQHAVRTLSEIVSYLEERV